MLAVRRACRSALVAVLLRGAGAAEAGGGTSAGDFLLQQALQCEYRSADECRNALARARSARHCVREVRAPNVGALWGRWGSPGQSEKDVGSIAGEFDGLACGGSAGDDAFVCRSLTHGHCGTPQGPMQDPVDCSLGCFSFRTATGSAGCVLEADVQSAYAFEPCDIRAMCAAMTEPWCGGGAAGGAGASAGGSFALWRWLLLAASAAAGVGTAAWCGARVLRRCCSRRNLPQGHSSPRSAGNKAASPGTDEKDAGTAMYSGVRLGRVHKGPAQFDDLDSDLVLSWEVLFAGSVNVRSAKSTSAAILTALPQGARVQGRQEGNWIALVGEPGFVQVHSGGQALMRQAPSDDGTAAGLPTGWESATDANTGRTYYFDQKRGKTQWTRPSGVRPVVVGSSASPE